MTPHDVNDVTTDDDTAAAGHGHGGGVFVITTNTRVFNDADVAPIRAEIHRLQQAVATELEKRHP